MEIHTDLFFTPRNLGLSNIVAVVNMFCCRNETLYSITTKAVVQITVAGISPKESMKDILYLLVKAAMAQGKLYFG